MPLIVVGLVKILDQLGKCVPNQLEEWFEEIGVPIIIFFSPFIIIVKAILSLLSQWGSLNLCMIILQESLTIFFIQYHLIVSDLSFLDIDIAGVSDYFIKLMKSLKGMCQ